MKVCQSYSPFHQNHHTMNIDIFSLLSRFISVLILFFWRNFYETLKLNNPFLYRKLYH